MKVPLITLRRGPFSVYDILWAVPVIFHLMFVASRYLCCQLEYGWLIFNPKSSNECKE